MAWQDGCFSLQSRLKASKDTNLTDVEFIVGGGTLKASRFMMACYSPVMEALFYGPTGLAAVAGVPVDIRDGTFRGFKGMLDFIDQENDFTLADLLEDPGKEEITESDELERVLEVLFFADKYQINSLISLCKNALLYEIKFSSRNIAPMFNAISSYQDNLREVFSLLISKMKDFEQTFFDIEIADTKQYSVVQKNDRQSQIKFTVNKASTFRFDCHKQTADDCNGISSSNPIKGITWQMEGSPKEIKQENKDTFEFYAEANKIITLNFEMCQVSNIFIFYEVKDAKYKVDDFELEVKEVNSKPYGEIGTRARIPFFKFSFRLISNNQNFQPIS